MVRDVASGREIHDFRHSGKQKQGRKDDTSRKSRYINFNVERQKILSHCHVVCSTLSGAGSKAFIESGKSENHSYSNLLKYMSSAGERLTKVKCAPPVSRDEFPHSEFDAVIIDEACQGSEMSCLIPFKYNPNAVVLVGDPNQLPVMTFSQDASRCKADRSLFDRLHHVHCWSPVRDAELSQHALSQVYLMPFHISIVQQPKVTERHPNIPTGSHHA